MPLTGDLLDALGLVLQINAHYYEGQTFLKQGDEYQPHFGETRDERIKEFHEMNDTPVIGLWEAGILEVAAGQVKLTAAPAKVFCKGKEPGTVEPGTELSGLLDDA